MMDPIEEYGARKQVEKLGHMFDMFKEEMDDPFRGRTIEKTVPLKPEWKQSFDELTDMAIQIAELTKKMNSKRKLLWGTINDQLNDYRDMHYDEKNGEIQIFKDEIEKIRKRT